MSVRLQHEQDVARIASVRNGAVTTVMVLTWALLSFAAAFRWLGPGRDYFEYLHYYNTIPYQFAFSDTRFEPGFHVVAWVFRNVFNVEYSILALVLVGVSLGLKFYLIRRYLSHPLLAMFTYIALFYPTHEYAQIRTALALAIGYGAVHLLFEKKYLTGGIAFILGVTFHYSVIMLALVYVGAQYVRGRAAVFVLVASFVVVTVLSAQLVGLATDVFSSYNPLLKYYISNSYFNDEVRITSLNNLLPLAALVLAVLLGWFGYGRYHATFLTMSLASLVAIVLLSGSPVVAQRLKELLFVSVIFLIYRSPIVVRNLPPIILIWATSALLLYLAFREGLVAL